MWNIKLKIVLVTLIFLITSPIKSFAGFGDLDLDGITKGLKGVVDQLDKNLKNNNQNNQPNKNLEKPPGAQPETAEEKQKRLESQKKAEQENKKKLEAQKKAEQEKKKELEAQKKAQQEKNKKLEAQKKAEQEKQKKLQAQRAKEEVERKRIEDEQRAEEEKKAKEIADFFAESERNQNELAEKTLKEELVFENTEEGKALKIETLEDIKKTPIEYCKSLTYETLLNQSIKENIDASSFYQSKFRLVRDILVHNADFINSKDLIEENLVFLKNAGKNKKDQKGKFTVDYITMSEEIYQKKKERGIEDGSLPRVLQDLVNSEAGKKDIKYFWLSGNYVFDQPDDLKLSMLNNANVDILFVKQDDNSNWEICDFECLIGSNMYLQVDLNGEHKTLFLSDLNLPEVGGWRIANSLKILRQNSQVSDVDQFTPKWIHKDNFNLFDFLAHESSKAYQRHYIWHQDWLVHVALAQALSHKNTDYQTCWNEHIKNEE